MARYAALVALFVVACTESKLIATGEQPQRDRDLDGPVFANGGKNGGKALTPATDQRSNASGSGTGSGRVGDAGTDPGSLDATGGVGRKPKPVVIPARPGLDGGA